MNAFEGGNSLEINMSGSVKKPKKSLLVGQMICIKKQQHYILSCIEC